MSSLVRRALVSLSIVAFLSSCSSEPSLKRASAELEAGFENPPQSAKPRVWWHWMNGNITLDGALKDLAWMNRIGIGGFQMFDAAWDTPQIVDERLDYMSEPWKEVFTTVTAAADSYGMEMAVAGSPGWSETGGPWVRPEQAMKKLVWSETYADSDAISNLVLEQPSTVSGVYKNLGDPAQERYYRDIAVLAVRLPDSYQPLENIVKRISASAGEFTLQAMTDDDYAGPNPLPVKPGERAWIQYEFNEPRTLYGVTLAGDRAESVCVSNDGYNFVKVADVDCYAHGISSIAFPAVEAKFLRMEYGPASARQSSRNVTEFVAYTMPRLHMHVEKAGFAAVHNLADRTSPTGLPGAEVLNLTDRMAENGILSWRPESGKWKVLRFGYSLTGHRNGPASPEATGLEVDKLDADCVRSYFDKYLSMYDSATGGLMGKHGLRGIITDSWEAGQLNWTARMPEFFKASRGYDLTCWLPAVAGYVVGSSEESDRFLWDFRRVIGDLTAANHYDALTDILSRRGMIRYTESHENMRSFVGDGMEVKRTADVPMSAIWVGDKALGWNGSDIRESASVAHIYGQKFVAAESLTAWGWPWSHSPAKLKSTADVELASGLNRFVIHESAHQALDDFKPGFTLGPFGQWFNRHDTWAEMAGPWIGYLTRSSFMLSQGTPVVDILYYYGEDSNITALYQNGLPALPHGYQFDFVNADALVNVIGSRGGVLTTPAGTEYRLLVLGDHTDHISVPVLRKLLSLAKAGVKIVGSRPLSTPSLSDSEEEFKSLCDELWNSGLVCDVTCADALTAAGIGMDVSDGRDESPIMFQHRVYGGAHIYWVAARNREAEDLDLSFRISGMEPEIWNAVDGSILEAVYRIEGDCTHVKAHFEPDDALFFVFRRCAQQPERMAPAPVQPVEIATLNDYWAVSFSAEMGAPSNTVFDTLQDWSLDPNPYISYYSGTAVYDKDFMLGETPEGKIELDLGTVHELARINLNGVDLGIVWKAPYRVDVSGILKSGVNHLRVEVANLWVNRIIGDRRGNAGSYTRSTDSFWKADSPLLPSGLLGPVVITCAK